MSMDPLYGRRFRPLMPRPFTGCSTNICAFSATKNHCCSLHDPNIPSWNQSLSGVSDYGAKREISRGLPMVSSRWNPTPEQLQALEEMYRRGTRTPSAEQIQQIAAKLRRYGKIEGKNVFYWFQNHKARDRQKKRRQLELSAQKHTEIMHPRQSGLSKRYSGIEHPRKLPTMSNCSSASKQAESVQGVQQCKGNEWIQMDRKEMQQQTQTAKSTETCCWPLDLSSSNSSIHKSTDQNAAGQENAYPFVALNFCKQLTPKNDNFRNLEREIKENQTLQLFPVRSNDLSTVSIVKEEIRDVSSIGTKLVPNQFFEFLPTKN